jgi:hypothetical protein
VGSLVPDAFHIVLPAEVSREAAPQNPAIVLCRKSAGSEPTFIRVDIVSSVPHAKMLPDFLTCLKATAGLKGRKIAVVIWAEGIVLMLRLSNVLQPFVFSSKRPVLGRARIVWTFPSAFRGMAGRNVPLKFTLVSERLFIGTSRLSAQNRVGVDIFEMSLERAR